MSNQGFTPGPWLLSGRTVYALNDEGFNRFSSLVQDAHTPGDELEANARLMAAAPELLKALEEAVKDLVAAQFNARSAARTDKAWAGVSEAIQPSVDKARAALAKARGTPC